MSRWGSNPVHPEWDATVQDFDEDDVPSNEDCDDGDERLGALPETCDGLDNDCDGIVDNNGACDRFQEFRQNGDVDLLIVLDPRLEAEVARERVFEGLAALIEPLLGPSRTTHVGVLSMDTLPAHLGGSHGGQLIGLSTGGAYLETTPQTEVKLVLNSLESAFAELQPPLGAMGAREVIERSVRDPNLVSFVNAGFDREGVFLAILNVSTTEDWSKRDVESLAGLLDEVEGEGRWGAWSIVQIGLNDCLGKPAPEHQGLTYIDLMWASDEPAAVKHHCNTDYSDFLAGMGARLAKDGLKQTFTLSDHPLAGTVEVAVTEGTLPRLLEPSEFIVQDNVLTVFEPPLPSSLIHVSYVAMP